MAQFVNKPFITELAQVFGIYIPPADATGGGASPTILARQSDGTVYVVSLGSVWKPILTRQSDGTVTVGA